MRVSSIQLLFLTILIFQDFSWSFDPEENGRKEVDSGKKLVEIEIGNKIFETDDRYVSFAIDSAQFLGGKWWKNSDRAIAGRGVEKTEPFDFFRPEFLRLVTQLGESYLRIGGSESDFTAYEFDGKENRTKTKSSFETLLKPDRWNELDRFLKRTDLELIFVLNAGPGFRDQDENLRYEEYQSFLNHVKAMETPVALWELGNEINGYWLIHGLNEQVSPESYASEFSSVQSQLTETFGAGTKLGGPGSAYWPMLGEPLSLFFGITLSFVAKLDDPLKVLTWHFYPSQSDRCPLAVRRSRPKTLLASTTLNEVRRWSRRIHDLKKQYQKDAEVWMTETGPAQCGGQPGLSDRYKSSLWWLDHLGTLAQEKHKVVVRQTLAGSDYGMIDNETLEPRPDYWSSLLFKKLLGKSVLRVDQKGPDSGTLRFYAHCMASSHPSFRPGAVSLLAINTSEKQAKSFKIKLPREDLESLTFTLTSIDPLGKEIYLNDQRILPTSSPHLEGHKKHIHSEITVEPLSAEFTTLLNFDHPACRS